jgi:hypothetical protein
MNSLAQINCGSQNVTTGAYVTLIASTSIPFFRMLATDTTGKVLKIAVGAAGHEVDICQLPVDDSEIINLATLSAVPVGSRLSLRAISATANSGYSAVTLLS